MVRESWQRVQGLIGRQGLVAMLCLTAVLVMAPAKGESQKKATEKHLLGLHEMVELPQLNVSMKAKLDTGALTSSLSATDIHRFKKDGEPWVRFRIIAQGVSRDAWHELPLVRTSRVKRRAEESKDDEAPGVSKRPVVEMKVRLGDQEKTIEVSLTDRSNFLYPFLLGARGLRAFGAVVDPSESYVLGEEDDK